jgi:hypothetical protein
MNPNLGIQTEPQMVKVNSNLRPEKVRELEEWLRKYKDFFAWTYKDLKGIPPKLVQHKIEFDTTISLAHQAKYQLNLNYMQQ